METTEPLTTFLASLPVDEATSAGLVARVQQRLAQRQAGACASQNSNASHECTSDACFPLLLIIAEAAAPLDETERARVAKLEEQLVALTAQLQHRRQSVPAWNAQRLEEQSRTALSQVMATANEPLAAPAGVEESESRLALTAASLQHCTAISAEASAQVSGEVQRVLDQANDVVAQIGATVGSMSGCATATDLAIASAEPEKENASHDIAAALRRRREQQQAAAATLARQAASLPAAFLTM